jgi:SAM-dependent MidA family methyltransferase
LSCELIDHLAEQLPELMHRLELVLVEDQSRDGTASTQASRAAPGSRTPATSFHNAGRPCPNLKTKPVIGVLIAHELLDAFPVERLELSDGQLRRQTVQLQQERW